MVVGRCMMKLVPLTKIWLTIWSLDMTLSKKILESNQELAGKLIHLVILILMLEYLLKWVLMPGFSQDLTIKIRIKEWMRKNWNSFGDLILRVLETILKYLLIYYINIMVLLLLLILMLKGMIQHGLMTKNVKILMLIKKQKISWLN